MPDYAFILQILLIKQIPIWYVFRLVNRYPSKIGFPLTSTVNDLVTII
jgi:hypothetical protein